MKLQGRDALIGGIAEVQCSQDLGANAAASMVVLHEAGQPLELDTFNF